MDCWIMPRISGQASCLGLFMSKDQSVTVLQHYDTVMDITVPWCDGGLSHSIPYALPSYLHTTFLSFSSYY